MNLRSVFNEFICLFNKIYTKKWMETCYFSWSCQTDWRKRKQTNILPQNAMESQSNKSGFLILYGFNTLFGSQRLNFYLNLKINIKEMIEPSLSIKWSALTWFNNKFWTFKWYNQRNLWVKILKLIKMILLVRFIWISQQKIEIFFIV